MTRLDCGAIREAIPELASGRDGGLAADRAREHLAACADCAAELDLVRLLLESRPEAPFGLARRVSAAVRGDRAGASRPWWGITAAAVAALALGIGIASEPGSQVEVEVPGYAYEVEEGTLWSSDDGLVAGAPMLEALSDEALEQLLTELTVGSAGGAA